MFPLLMLAGAACAAESVDILWLSETAPPKAAKAEGTTQSAMHDHHHVGHDMAMMAASAPVAGSGAAEGKKHNHDEQISLDGDSPGKDHRAGKQVWLRQGDSIKTAPYVVSDNISERLMMVDLGGRKTSVASNTENGRMTLKTDLPEIGFYETYLEQREVRDGRLLVRLPKIELLWANCSAKAVDEEEVAKPIVNDQSALELVREHKPDEGCMARLVSGDVVNFRVLSYGKPVAGVPVTMVTQEGWRNTQTSDESGKVAFTMIREYYPKWFEFKKFHTDTFLTIAEMDKPEAGVLEGRRYSSAHYVATLPGKYRPSPYDYRSYAWGLGISLFVVVFGGLAVYLYRRRRLKPYREERVDGRA